jgi:hypothetical protein
MTINKKQKIYRTDLNTYLLAPWSGVLENLTGSEIVKKTPPHFIEP